MDSINVKLEKLRGLMAENGIDAYLITKADPHQSENARAYWNGVQFISGFKGSAGTVVVTKDKAGLWTDGRYSIQSREQVKGTEFNVYITSEPGTKSYVDFIKNEVKEKGRLGFDSRTLSVSDAEKLENTLKEKEIVLFGNKDLLGPIWENRPEDIGGKVFDHLTKYCGTDRVKKIEDVRKSMAEKEGDTYIISSLDDIAWLLNLRCADDETLCFPAYVVMTKERTTLFANEEKLSDVLDILKRDQVEIMPYESINEFLNTLESPGKIMITPSKTSYSLYSEIKNEKIVKLDFDITTNMKARKNPIEIENNKEISIKDGAALVKFIIWIKEACKNSPISEYEAGLKMDSLRKEIEGFVHTSFSTICGYGGNAAQAHYRATEDKNSVIKPEG
ncbi:MAG: aminopeptidase P family protein, partial [Lachnospiraceae bacterium]|nr:aminopeptidase P family protein [Lachnospiraceae bacterium]